MVGENGWVCWIQGGAGSELRCFLEAKIKANLCMYCIDFASIVWI